MQLANDPLFAAIFRWKTSMLRVLGLGVAVGCCSCTQALACPGPSFERTIIFNHVPTDVDAPVIAEVTIVDMKPEDLQDPSNSTGMAVMNARVENVIKGKVGPGMLKIVTPLTDCSNGFGVGSHGFVAGELQRDANGNFELVAISENVRKASARPH
ncbi:MAG TPA: hypothetical protein VE111_18955 [Bradyrhizobium sp.]|nr:hypothetical protein [Bradyrhizobium sp.]